MADPILAFRTVTEIFMVRYEYVGSPPVLTPIPIAIPINPDSFEVNPGIELQDIEQTGCTGENQIVLTYATKTVPEIKMSFGLSTPEIESMIINRVAEVRTTYTDGWVYFGAVADNTTIAGKASGKYGNTVTAQSAATSKALVYYIDPLTKLSKPLEIVDSAPTGDQIVIGNSLALTLSPELAATGYNLYGWVPDVTHSNATVLGSTSIPQVGIWAVGICFDETVREFSARKCSLRPQSSLTKDPKRDVSLRVLADSKSTTGMGYSIVYVRDKIAC